MALNDRCVVLKCILRVVATHSSMSEWYSSRQLASAPVSSTIKTLVLIAMADPVPTRGFSKRIVFNIIVVGTAISAALM